MRSMNRTTLIASIAERGLHDPQRTGPLYRNLARILGELVEEEKLAPGAGLPPERDLAEQLGVGRITVRNAYKELLARGAVEARRGSGTFVAERPPRISQPLWHLTSFSQDTTSRGKEPAAPVGDTLLPASLTERLVPPTEKPRDEDEELDADAVFAKLSALKSKDEDEDGEE